MRTIVSLALVAALAGCGEDPHVPQLQSRVSALEQEKALLEEKLRDHEQSVVSLQKKVKEVEDARVYTETLRVQAGESSADMDARLRALEGRNAALARDLAKARAELATAQGTASSARTEAAAARTRAEEEADRRAEAETAATEAERRATDTPRKPALTGTAAAACAAIAQALNYRKVSGELTDPLKVDTAFLEWLTSDGGWGSRDVADLSAWTGDVWRAIDAGDLISPKSNKPKEIEVRDYGKKMAKALLDVREEFLDGDTAAALKSFRFWYPER